MFEWYYLSQALRYIDQIPREVTIGVATYFLVTETHKRHANMIIEKAKIEAKAKEIELEVEKLKLQLELRDAKLS